MIYLANCHYLFPTLLIMVYSGFLFAMIPVFGLSGFSVSLTVLFTVSLWDGFFSYKLCGNDMRAVIVLKTGSAVKYYVSNEILLALLAFGYTILILLYPFQACIFQAESLNWGDIAELAAIMLVHLLVALCGYQLGSLFQPQMIGKRLPAALLIIVTVLGMFLRYQMSMVPIVKYLFWIFPPIVKMMHLLYTEEEFFCAEIGDTVIQLALYTAILFVCKGFLLSRRNWAVYE